ncbi:MAG: SirB2 family protein [Dechloromonas sp.]|uniref:SirB2 family protein n=1 Tax=Candidatus Dechloromonas phosphorivorans TaxID=2899244 RepID=A0A9D7LRQ2_9RHOO|nr:SirB2 family protein [Candidatus Dechloromonas phosphorivorans]
MSYLALKHLHVTCVVLSGLGFALRGWWMLAGSPLLKARLAKVVPHVVDTVLLGSALAMAWQSGQYPFAQNWLTAKFFGLLAYILCGTMALKRGRTPRQRPCSFWCWPCWLAPYIVGVRADAESAAPAPVGQPR